MQRKADIEMARLSRSFDSATQEGSLFRALGEFDPAVATTEFERNTLGILKDQLDQMGGVIPAFMWNTLLAQLGFSPDNDMGQMVRALTELHTAPRPLGCVQAIAIRPGMGEMQRWQQACDVYQPDQILLVMGAWDGEKTWQPTPEILAGYGIDPTNPNVHFQPTARNTKDQSNWFVAKLHELGIMSVAISVAKYHQARSYATDLAGLIDNGMEYVAMFPFPTSNDPQDIIPETGIAMGSSYEGEYQRIVTYRNSGHVAGWKQLADYLADVVKYHRLVI